MGMWHCRWRAVGGAQRVLPAPERVHRGGRRGRPWKEIRNSIDPRAKTEEPCGQSASVIY